MKRNKIISVLLIIVMVASMTAAMGISVSAKGGWSYQTSATLTDLNNSKTIDQKYSLTVSTGSYTDVTKVKLEWTLENLSFSRKDNKIWDPDTLAWVANGSTFTGSETANASFVLTNLSSVPVKANAVFRVENALRDTFAKITFTNNDCTVASVVDAETKAVNTGISHAQTISAALKVNKDKFTGAAASNATYGTYVISISSVAGANEGKVTVNTNEKTTLTAQTAPSQAAADTTSVEIPAGTTQMTAGAVADLTVQSSAVAVASADASFNITENESAVSAITLTLSVNGTPVSSFTDANGAPVAVTVTTYIAKGFTNVTLKYVGNGDDPTDVTYDPATGKLTFKTTHFSTFAVGADEDAYVKETDTAYMLQDALNAMEAGQTVMVLKDIPDCSILRADKTASGTYTIDFNHRAVTFTDTTVKDQMAFVIEGEGAWILKDGTLNCDDYHYGDVFETWANTTLNRMTINFNDENVNGFARWGAVYSAGESVVLNDCVINAIAGPGIQNGEEGMVMYLNRTTVISLDHSAMYCGGGSTTHLNDCTVSGKNAVHACTSGAAYVINGGTYTATVNAIQLDNTTSAIDYQGVPNYVGGSYAQVKGGSFNGAIKLTAKVGNGQATLDISGGTFTADPSAYVASGYAAAQSGSTWTVTASEPQ